MNTRDRNPAEQKATNAIYRKMMGGNAVISINRGSVCVGVGRGSCAGVGDLRGVGVTAGGVATVVVRVAVASTGGPAGDADGAGAGTSILTSLAFTKVCQGCSRPIRMAGSWPRSALYCPLADSGYNAAARINSRVRDNRRIFKGLSASQLISLLLPLIR
jgi:hypothetical protein